MKTPKIYEEVDSVIQRRFVSRHSNTRNCTAFWHNELCNTFSGTILDVPWVRFWRKINTRKYFVMNEYYEGDDGYREEWMFLLRLLVVEDFKAWLHQQSKEKPRTRGKK